MSIFDAEVILLEPFDPSTPRLTFRQIRELVGALHGVTLQTLAQVELAYRWTKP